MLHGASPHGAHCHKTPPPRICTMGPMTVSILYEKMEPILDTARDSCVMWCHVCDCTGATTLRCDPIVPHGRPSSHYPKAI